MQEVLLGAVAMGSAVAALFFLRFWRQTRERLFLIFALAFLVDAVMRVVLAVTEVPNEQEPFFYLGRLLTFILIVIAIVDKNRGSGASRR
jgi:uncharacterized membrane protein HdeD (DUF308 family)